MARYELNDGSSNKFWDIVITGNSFTTTYGRIGTAGRSTTKHFDTPAKAKKAAQALIDQKQGKGYVKVSAGGRNTSPPKATKKKATKKKATKTRKEPKASMARGPTLAFINRLLSLADQFEEQGYEDDEDEMDEERDQVDEMAETWDRHQNDLPDGVAWDDAAVAKDLRARLHVAVDKLVQEQPADYHPGSGTCVRDIVHPSMYPFIRGKTKLSPDAVVPNTPAATEFDFWGRRYEDSKFQWLPTPFTVGRDGTVQIGSYINNLDRNIYPQIYDDLAELFATALPLFESVYGYATSMKFVTADDYETPDQNQRGKPLKSPRPVSLKGRELQVVTKIVEYDVGKTPFEGVWHVEGMSHEHIVATGVYILHRDETLDGGDIMFKRAYTREEAGLLFWNVVQCRSDAMNEVVGRGEIPIGTLATPDNRLFVFPNSHIHKLSPMRATKGKSAKRRVVVFWLVDPNVPIVSTREVWPQQAVLSRKDAEKNRLQLMKVRKLYKQSLNERAVSLCEH